VLTSRHIYRSLLVLGIIFLVVVCTELQFGQSPPPTELSVPGIVIQHASSPYSMLDAFTLDSRPLGQVAQRVQSVIQVCMNRHGWNYWNPTHIVYNSEYTNLGSFWKFRSREGYGASSQVIDEALHRLIPSEQNFQYLGTLTPLQRSMYWLDLTGSSTAVDNYLPVPLTVPIGKSRGCEATARRSVLASLPYFQLDLRKQIANLYSDQSSGGLVIKGALEWGRCMARAGYRVRYFDQEEVSFFQTSNSLTLGAAKREFPAEKTAAVADATCFLKHLYPAESKYDKVLLTNFARSYPTYQRVISRIIKSLSI